MREEPRKVWKKQNIGIPGERGTVPAVKEYLEQYEQVYAAERTGIKFRENTDKWNKNMISRILEDDRYWKGSPFPEIITQQTAWKAMELKAEKTAPKSEIPFLRRKLICYQCFKALHRNGKSQPNVYWDCPKCGMRVGPISDQEFLCAVAQKILTLCREPEKSYRIQS